MSDNLIMGWNRLKASIPATVSLVAIVPIGFYCKFYRGPGARWVNDSLCGSFYEMFWCLVGFLLWPKTKPRSIARIVLGLTCILEFMQLWHPRLLEFLRSYFLGAAILGTSFDWSDFPYYFLGTGAGWLWVAMLAKRRPAQFPE